MLVPAGCGGDEEASTAPRPPELTVPGDETATDETDTGSTGTSADPAPAPAPQPGRTPTPPRNPPRAPDSPENDIPPEPGTPESRFEQFCEQNPGACG